MSQSFDDDLKLVDDLFYLASKNLKTSIFQTINLFNDKQYVTFENTKIDDALFISTSNIQTVTLWSDHTYHEMHTTFKNMSVNKSISDLSKKDDSANELLRLTSEHLESSTS